MKKSEASSSFGRSVTDDATDNFLDGVNIQFRSLHQIKTENRRVKRQNEKLSKEIEELTKKYEDLTKK
uniref:Uncharacterized protein n=1 Tax=Oryza brachyantha TaxID=4533 RepID=J3LVI4_ORYBR